MNDVLSTRLSIRKRGGSLGHHQAIEKEERFSSWRHEEVGKLVWTLGAMAAEHVFYGENSTGVGGDVQSATWRASRMVGMCGMGPEPLDLRGRVAKERLPEEREGAHGALRADRPADHEPRALGQRDGRRPDRLGRSATRPSAARRPRSSARPTSPPCAASAPTARPSRASPTRSSSTRSSTATRWSSCSRRADPRAPAIDVLDESIWPKV